MTEFVDISAVPFQLLLITNLPEAAAHAVASGVDRVFVDLESKGKHERQAGRSTVISGHAVEDITRVRTVVPRGKLLVRINPWDQDSKAEIEAVIERGADEVMLPMFRDAATIESLVRAVDGRCGVVGLLETADAAANVRDIARVQGLTRIHIGLNDLHLALRRRFMFELLVDGTVTNIASALRAAGVPFGIGGLARVGEGLVPAELLVAEHIALGSSGAILSRTFHRGEFDRGVLTNGPALAAEIGKLRAAIDHCRKADVAQIESMRAESAARIRRIVDENR